MPELRDLLEGAVDPPAPLDLDHLGRRVAAGRRRQRRRRATTLAAVLAVLLGGGALALRAGSDGRSGDGEVDTAATSTPSTTPTTAPSGTGAPPWPDCTEADFDLVPNEGGEQPSLTVHPVAGAPECVLTTLMTFTFLDPVDLPNPLGMETGMLWNQEDQGPLTFMPMEVTLNLTPPAALVECGLEAGHGYRVRAETTIVGFGPLPSTPPADMCE